jgi:hypothetical protein
MPNRAASTVELEPYPSKARTGGKHMSAVTNSGSPDLTYARIRQEIENRGGSTVSRDRNSLAAWMAGAAETIVVDAVLIADDEARFVQKREQLVGAMTFKAVGPNGQLPATADTMRRNRRAGLNAVRAIARDLSQQTALEALPLRELIQQARKGMGLTWKEFYFKYGQRVSNWIKPKPDVPSPASREILTRIADDAEMPRELFLAFVRADRKRARNQQPTQRQARWDATYSLSSRGYVIPGLKFRSDKTRNGIIRDRALGDELQQELASFVEYKTAEVPNVARSERGRWTENAHGRDARKQSGLRHIEWLLGFVSLPPDAGDPLLSGLGVPVDDLCFCMLGDAAIFHSFADFQERRGNSKRSSGQIAALCKTLMHPKTGYVRLQRRHFRRQLMQYLELPQIVASYIAHYRLPKRPYSPEQLLEEIYLTKNQDREQVPKDFDLFDFWAAEQHDWLRRFGAGAMKGRAAARDPHVRLRPILSRERPMGVVFDLIGQMERATKAYGSDPSHSENIILQNDKGLVAFMAAIPVRGENIANAQVDPAYLETIHPAAPLHPLPNLFKQDGKWWYREELYGFKNRQHLEARGAPPYYETEIAGWAQPYIEDLITVWRRKAPGAKAGSPYLVVDYRTERLGIRMPWEPVDVRQLGNRMLSISRAYLGIDLGADLELRLHWIRHVVVSDFLKQNPGAYKAAARILNDAEETVRRVYSYLDTRDGMGMFNAGCDALFRHMRRKSVVNGTSAEGAGLEQEVRDAHARLAAEQEALRRAHARIAELEAELAALRRAA